MAANKNNDAVSNSTSESNRPLRLNAANKKLLFGLVSNRPRKMTVQDRLNQIFSAESKVLNVVSENVILSCNNNQLKSANQQLNQKNEHLKLEAKKFRSLIIRMSSIEIIIAAAFLIVHFS
ncbi:hypothetical protein VXS06_14755 [Photobacterium toruni]|uniref:Uncharacterized protein n=1 Tax=Photobacterium toruni TaxID=1935446 RepID=A0ABU6L8Z1_9GAMM|nr:hypothetical protein [Photobacterium toruni]